MNNKTDIEEDIKVLQKFVKIIKGKDYNADNGWHGYYDNELIFLGKAIENILADRERVLEENNIYKEGNKIYKEEYNKIAKALDFKEGILNPDASIVIKSMKQALIQLQIKANAYDSLVEKIKETIELIEDTLDLSKENGKVAKYKITAMEYELEDLKELLDTEK